ncbi:MAG: NUDIX domain-containing protein [Candidatus Hydrogenedentes bacterium]|nr:NUDIX domain-containing protein [Candidatus Hydrogenedentota bacterium]
MKTRRYRAAGGIVLDSSLRVLLIERHVVRDNREIHEVRLPKGHIDPGETDAEAAVRETCEETGYCQLDVIADLGESVSEYDFENVHYHRNEHYYLMRLRSAERRPIHAAPGSEEALFSPLWAESLQSATSMLTYETERDFALRAAEWLRKSAQQAQQQ